MTSVRSGLVTAGKIALVARSPKLHHGNCVLYFSNVYF